MLFIGRAQEKTGLFRTEKRRNAEGRAYPWIVRSTGVVNHYYVYAVDADFGPFFLKFCSYFPYNTRLCINGHEWAKRQAAKAGVGHTVLDNGLATCNDPAALQAVCDRLGPTQIQALPDKWLAILPSAFTEADRGAGYRYECSVPQAEFSLTQALDRPVSLIRNSGRHQHHCRSRTRWPEFLIRLRDRAGILRAGHPRQPRRRALSGGPLG